VSHTALFRYVLGLADDQLVLGHRLSQWTGRAPMLEEELALGNIALDLIGQARGLYQYAGEIEGDGRDEDVLAYHRDARGYLNLTLVEQPNGDFAKTIVRQLFYTAMALPFWQAMATSTDQRLAAVAAKAEKESAYNLRHATEWTARLGDGTEESHRRMQAAINQLWEFTGELFEMNAAEVKLATAGIAPERKALRAGWHSTVNAALDDATLTRPDDSWMAKGGRDGLHGEDLGHMLAEMQSLQRMHPGLAW
jgi:ring-1,2-phenylacetyl-CoA epoxidase subunit PaaC